MVSRRTFDGFYLLDKRMASPERIGPHSHKTANLTLVLAGSYAEEFDHGRQRCPEWSLQFKPASLPHTTSSGERGVRMFVVAFDRTHISGRRLEAANRALIRRSGAVAAVALRLFQVAFCSADPRRDQIEGLVSELIDAAGARLDAAPDGQPPAWLTEAEERIRALEPKTLGLSGLARVFRVHPVYLARVFRRHYGRSVGSYLRRCRADRAAELLTGSDLPLGVMAVDLGYYDQSHFSADFKRQTGYTPHAFRRETHRLALLAAKK